MQRTPPRHLAPPPRTRPRAREHLLVESILALVAIGLTTVILLSSLLNRPESSAARLPNLLPPAPTTTRAAATTPSPASTRPASKPNDGNLLADAGFEAGVSGWSAVGKAGLERVEYTVGVEGCNQRKVYIILCQVGTDTCFAASPDTRFRS